MWKIITLLAILALCSSGSPAQDQEPSDTLTSSLPPFTAATHYMSLRGFQRYLHYQQTGVWPKSDHFLLFHGPLGDVSLFDVATVNGSTVTIDLGELHPDVWGEPQEKARQLAFEAFPDYSTVVVRWSFTLFNSTDHFHNTFQRAIPKISAHYRKGLRAKPD